MAIHINADDPVQVDALFHACEIILRYRRRYRRWPNQARIDAFAAAIANTAGDGIAANRERRAEQRDYWREHRDGWT